MFSRGIIDIDDSSYVLGEGEAIWLLKLILPYLNEFLLKLKALFSGDPATTMKVTTPVFCFCLVFASFIFVYLPHKKLMNYESETWLLAVLLFVLARCGSSITIWKMIKVGKLQKLSFNKKKNQNFYLLIYLFIVSFNFHLQHTNLQSVSS